MRLTNPASLTSSVRSISHRPVRVLHPVADLHERRRAREDRPRPWLRSSILTNSKSPSDNTARFQPIRNTCSTVISTLIRDPSFRVKTATSTASVNHPRLEPVPHVNQPVSYSHAANPPRRKDAGSRNILRLPTRFGLRAANLLSREIVTRAVSPAIAPVVPALAPPRELKPRIIKIRVNRTESVTSGLEQKLAQLEKQREKRAAQLDKLVNQALGPRATDKQETTATPLQDKRISQPSWFCCQCKRENVYQPGQFHCLYGSVEKLCLHERCWDCMSFSCKMLYDRNFRANHEARINKRPIGILKHASSRSKTSSKSSKKSVAWPDLYSTPRPLIQVREYEFTDDDFAQRGVDITSLVGHVVNWNSKGAVVFSTELQSNLWDYVENSKFPAGIERIPVPNGLRRYRQVQQYYSIEYIRSATLGLPFMREPTTYGWKDGRRFTYLRGCGQTPAHKECLTSSGAKRLIALVGEVLPIDPDLSILSSEFMSEASWIQRLDISPHLLKRMRKRV